MIFRRIETNKYMKHTKLNMAVSILPREIHRSYSTTKLYEYKICFLMNPPSAS